MKNEGPPKINEEQQERLSRLGRRIAAMVMKMPTGMVGGIWRLLHRFANTIGRVRNKIYKGEDVSEDLDQIERITEDFERRLRE
ncbi:MAG: hypothetical protein AAB573_04170 [Patescibacteria group bacterium]